jgi:hypothetical protein
LERKQSCWCICIGYIYCFNNWNFSGLKNKYSFFRVHLKWNIKFFKNARSS